MIAGLTGLTLLCTSAPFNAFAAEGVSSHSLPGAVGDIFLAVPPEPGLLAANMLWYQTGSTDIALIGGLVSLGIDLDLFLNLTSLTYGRLRERYEVVMEPEAQGEPLADGVSPSVSTNERTTCWC